VRYLETLDTDPSSKYVQQLWSAGAEADVPLSTRVTATAGLAFDRVRNPETGGRTESDDERDDVAGRLGLSAEFGPARVHGAVSQRSRFPALRELYSGSLGRFAPNPDLRPEQLATVSFASPCPAASFSQNRDEIRASGIEAVATWEHRRVSLLGDLLVQRVRVHDVDAPDNARRPENVPETRFTLGASAPAFASINVNAWLSHTGDQYCEASEARMKRGTRLDLGADRGFSVVHGWLRELRVSFGVDNVGDGTVYDQCGLPQPGRTFRAALSWQLTAESSKL
jgi:iron complex outermembrane receptor protein